MKISEVYKKYKINQGLQQHMLRVAAVAHMISETTTVKTDTHSIVSACLLHDMGNLIKVSFDVAPELLEPEGVAYWQQIQQEMIATYGTDVHKATAAMVTEITPDPEVMRIVDDIEFDRIDEVAESGDITLKIAEYADLRVGMYGITSLDERFDNLKVRYAYWQEHEEEFESKRKDAKRIETDILAATSFNPTDITDESTAELQKELLEWEV